MNEEVKLYDGIVGSIPSSNNGQHDWFVTGTPVASNPVSEISQLVLNSENYKRAYAILSAESDKSWLSRLEQIPYMVLDASSTWFDDHNWSNKSEDKQASNYQYCMEQISALMAEYQAWKNSLPSTQVNQQSVVGFNSAITGQNLGASSIPNVGVSSNPSSLASTNGIEVFGSAISTASSLLSSVSGGALSWLSQFVSMSQYDRSQTNTERQTTQAIKNSELANNLALANVGVSGIQGTHGYEEIDATNVAPIARAKQSAEYKKAVLDDYTTFNPPAPLLGTEIQEVYDKIANLKFEMVLKRLEVEKEKANYESKLHQFNSGYLTDDPESFGASKSSYEKSQYEYDKFVKTRSLELLQDISEKSKNGSIVHTYMLDNILTGIDFSTLIGIQAASYSETIGEALLDKLGIEFTR